MKAADYEMVRKQLLEYVENPIRVKKGICYMPPDDIGKLINATNERVEVVAAAVYGLMERLKNAERGIDLSAIF